MNVCDFTGTRHGSRGCILGNEDSSVKHFLEIETTPPKSCSPQQLTTSDQTEYHIINIPENANIW